jgi:hypothetical protein
MSKPSIAGTGTAAPSRKYDHPAYITPRTTNRNALGGAANTIYGRERLFHQARVLGIYAYVTAADAAGAAWQAYYSPGATPDGSADVAIGAAWTVGTGAAGTMKTIALADLTASGALAVDKHGYPLFAPGDSIYLKSGGSNGANGRIDICYEWQITADGVFQN